VNYAPFVFSLNENLEDFKRKARLCVEKSLEEFDRESPVTSGNIKVFIV
jgi:hypothetical protein